MSADLMRAALELAHDSIRRGGGPFGAVVTRAGVIVGRGSNRVVASHDPTAHAEIVAIRDAAARLGSHDLTGCEIYASCEPCPMCLGAILWARLARIHRACDRHDAAAVGFDDERFYAELSLPPEQRGVPVTILERDAGLGVFRAWLDHEGRTPY